MNILKIVSVLLFFFLVTTPAQAGKTYGKLTFGGETGFVRVNLNVPPTRMAEVKPKVDEEIKGFIQSKTHPFAWTSTHAEFFWVVNGALSDVYQDVKRSPISPSWIWRGINASKPIKLVVRLEASGSGDINLIQDGNCVGYFRCQSSQRSKQPHSGSCSILKKWAQSGTGENKGEKGKISQKWGTWMPWALELKNSNTGCFIHGGDITTQSDGCIRIGRGIAAYIYPLIQEGAQVEIVYE